MLTIPNILTLLRIILIPCFIIAAVYKRYDYGLAIFIGAAVTDKLDGLIARMTGTSTPLGRFLDPLADKFMLLTTFVVFFIEALIPVWLAIVVISRDIIVVVGWFLLYLTGQMVNVEPSGLGKSAIASQFVLFSVILIEINFGALGGLKGALIWIAAALTAVSGLQYILMGLQLSSGRKTGH